MQTHELNAWLGPAADDLTDDQKADLAAAFDAISERYPDPDDDRRQAATTAAGMLALGDATLAEAADTWRAAQAAEREAMAALTGAVIASDATMSEAEIVRETGVNRMTIRKALGK